MLPHRADHREPRLAGDVLDPHRVHAAPLRQVDVDLIGAGDDALLPVGGDVRLAHARRVRGHVDAARRFEHEQGHGTGGEGLHLPVDGLEIDPLAPFRRDGPQLRGDARQAAAEVRDHPLRLGLAAGERAQVLPVGEQLVRRGRLERHHAHPVLLEDAHQVGVAAADHRPDEHQVRLQGEDAFRVVLELDPRPVGQGPVCRAAGDDLAVEPEAEEVFGMRRVERDDAGEGAVEHQGPAFAVGDGGPAGRAEREQHHQHEQRHDAAEHDPSRGAHRRTSRSCGGNRAMIASRLRWVAVCSASWS